MPTPVDRAHRGTDRPELENGGIHREGGRSRPSLRARLRRAQAACQAWQPPAAVGRVPYAPTRPESSTRTPPRRHACDYVVRTWWHYQPPRPVKATDSSPLHGLRKIKCPPYRHFPPRTHRTKSFSWRYCRTWASEAPSDERGGTDRPCLNHRATYRLYLPLLSSIRKL